MFDLVARLRLFWYNNVTRVRRNRYNRKYLLPEFIAEGHDPKFFPHLGKICFSNMKYVESIIATLI